MYKHIYVCVCVCVCAQATQLCPTLCDPMDCSPPGFSVHGISQARIFEWVSISCSRDLSDPMDCSPPGFSVHGTSQIRILEWVAISSSRGSFDPEIEPGSPALHADSSPSEPPGKPQKSRKSPPNRKATVLESCV